MAVGLAAGALAVSAGLGLYKLGEGRGEYDTLRQQAATSAAEIAGQLEFQRETVDTVREALETVMPPEDRDKLSERLDAIGRQADAFVAEEGVPEQMRALSGESGVSVETLMGLMALTPGGFSMQRATGITGALRAEQEKTGEVRGDHGGIESGENIIGAGLDLDTGLILGAQRADMSRELFDKTQDGLDSDSTADAFNDVTGEDRQAEAGYTIIYSTDAAGRPGSLDVHWLSGVTPQGLESTINGLTGFWGSGKEGPLSGVTCFVEQCQ